MALTQTPTAGWIYEPPVEHRCHLPSGRDLDRRIVGSVWKCGECDREYEVISESRPNRATTKRLVEAS